MELEQTLYLIGEIESYIGGHARRKGWALEVYQPLIDELSRLRTLYSRYRYDRSSLVHQDVTEEDLARELLLGALSTVYALLILPVLMIDKITHSKAMQLPAELHVADKVEHTAQDDALVKVLTDVDPQDSERLSGELVGFFRLLVNETVGYLREVDDRASAEAIMGLSQEFFGEI